MSNETKHTPGPWNYVGQGKSRGFHLRTIRDARNCYVAELQEIDGLTTPNIEANARLIAAAPDLLEALKAARYAVKYYDEHEGATNMREQVDAAIAKAEGRE